MSTSKNTQALNISIYCSYVASLESISRISQSYLLNFARLGTGGSTWESQGFAEGLAATDIRVAPWQAPLPFLAHVGFHLRSEKMLNGGVYGMARVKSSQVQRTLFSKIISKASIKIVNL